MAPAIAEAIPRPLACPISGPPKNVYHARKPPASFQLPMGPSWRPGMSYTTTHSILTCRLCFYPRPFQTPSLRKGASARRFGVRSLAP